MMLQFRILFSVLLLCSPALARTEPPAPTASQEPPLLLQTPVIAVADFTGEDPATARFLADTLLTDLAQSHELQLVERNELRRALSELKLQDTGLFEPQQLQALGRLVRADKLLVGSYLIRENQIIINARLLDLATGRVKEGGASNITGDTRSLLSVVHRLAHIFHRHVTGNDFAIDGEGAEAPESRIPARENVPTSRPPAPPPAPSTDGTYRIGGGDTLRNSSSQRPTQRETSSSNSYRIRESQPPQDTRTAAATVHVYNPPAFYTPPILPTYLPVYVPPRVDYSRYAYWNYYPYNRSQRSVVYYPRVHISVNLHSRHFSRR